MKKWFGKICVLLLAVILAFSFGACSSSNDKSANASASEKASQSTGETADVSEVENASDKTGTTAAKAGEATTETSDKSKKKATTANSGNQPTTEKKSSSSGSKTISKKSTTKKKTTTTKKKSTEKKTTKPKTFAMSASEIRSYALDQIAKIDGTIYDSGMSKNNAGWYSPEEIYLGESSSEIKQAIRENINFVYNGTTKNGYNVYVESRTDHNGTKIMKVYFLYGQIYTGPPIIDAE